MFKLKSLMATITMVLIVSGLTVFAQGPLQKRVNYAINADYALRMGDYILPAGHYVLYQVSPNNLNLFALYKDDLTHSPIAMIQTARIDYSVQGYPEKTKMMLNIEETANGREDLPVLKGWTIPGMDGWEIIGVVEKERGVLTHIQ